MTTFRGRFEPARKWEDELIRRLHERGWLAAPFGQAQIPEDMREHLAIWEDDYGRPTLLRWTPDIIAIRPTRPPFVCLIDAKTESEKNTAGPNYSVEINAVTAGQAIVRDWHVPLFYAWPDGGVMTPELVLNRHHSRNDGANANGSKTAFYLIAKRWAANNNAVFPCVTEVA